MIALLGVTTLTALTASPLGGPRRGGGRPRRRRKWGRRGCPKKQRRRLGQNARRHALSAGPRRMPDRVGLGGRVRRSGGGRPTSRWATPTPGGHIWPKAGSLLPLARQSAFSPPWGTFQNVSLMGWGTQDPEPVPGTYSWGSLDSRIEVMAATVPSNKRMITLCRRARMDEGGRKQPRVEHGISGGFVALYRISLIPPPKLPSDTTGGIETRSVKLLPKVDYFDVWNEMKGFWDTATNSWNVQEYTTLYNDVYAAIKAVRAPSEGSAAPTHHLPPPIQYDHADASPIHGSFGERRPTRSQRHHLLAGPQDRRTVREYGRGAGFNRRERFSGEGRYFAAARPLGADAGQQLVHLPEGPVSPIMWAEFYPGIPFDEAGPRRDKRLSRLTSAMLSRPARRGWTTS